MPDGSPSDGTDDTPGAGDGTDESGSAASDGSPTDDVERGAAGEKSPSDASTVDRDHSDDHDATAADSEERSAQSTAGEAQSADRPGATEGGEDASTGDAPSEPTPDQEEQQGTPKSTDQPATTEPGGEGHPDSGDTDPDRSATRTSEGSDTDRSDASGGADTDSFDRPGTGAASAGDESKTHDYDAVPGETADAGAVDATGSPTADDAPPADAGPSTAGEAATVEASEDATEQATAGNVAPEGVDEADPTVPPDVRKYDRFKKIEGGTYDRANEFLRDRTYITAREWAIARLCADFRTETGVEMTKIGENLPELVPFMTDTYSPQAVNQARAAFEEKVRKAGATFLYGAMCDFFTAEELDDVMYEATEVAKFLLEVEGVELSVEEELEAEDEISRIMREVREHSAALRHDEIECPDCGTHFEATAADATESGASADVGDADANSGE